MEHTMQHTMQHTMGAHSYDNVLVIISYLIAVVASYNVLDLTGRISKSSGRIRWMWLLFGAFAMGMGIWSMHFVGMMAMSLQVPISYDLFIVLVSVGFAMLASLLALLVVSKPKVPLPQLLGGASLFALGIVLMHYSGMYAMQVQIHYDLVYVLLSIFIAFIASISALCLSSYFLKNTGTPGDVMKRVGSALIMGAAIAGMHYVGMMGADIQTGTLPDRVFPSLNIIFEQKRLAYIISIGSLLTLVLSLVGMYISRLFAKKESERLVNEKWHKSLYEHNQDGIISVDLERRVIGINPAALRIGGIKEKDYLFRRIGSLLSIVVEEERERIRMLFVTVFMKGKEMRSETTLYKGEQERIEVAILIAPVIVDGQVAGNYVIIRDITQEKRMKLKNQHMAYHDELTGLPNRRMLNQMLLKTIDAHLHTQKKFAVMIIDLDRFKLINDSVGHIYGDLTLQEMGRRLKNELKNEDTILARMGGDEFAILIREYQSEAHMHQLAERMNRVIDTPYSLMDSEFHVTGSIGISVFPEHGQDALHLLKNADIAMYEVKKNGRNGYLIFSDELKEQLQESMILENDLRKALERNEFELYYQPQMHSVKGNITGVEALVRWNHPTRGLLAPGAFISVAEETGMIVELGNWVLREACRQMKYWQDAGGPFISIGVNLSARQFHQLNLVNQIQEILLETGLNPEYLDLEITESMMMDAMASINILNQITELGIRISLDDFGTGFSSFTYLKMFPIHKVKIDRSFIQHIAVNSSDRAIVSTMITMARQLNMGVIAEGIETREQLDIMIEQDCGEVQGYYFSKPLPVLEVERIFILPEQPSAKSV